jgi:hypothetical protein
LSFFPRLSWDSGFSCSSSDTCEWFISPIPEDLANQCIKASHDFVVVKEQFTDSETWRTVTSITFSRKGSRWKVYQVVREMKTFYTSADFPLYGYALEKRATIPKARGLLALRSRKKSECVVTTSRNPQRRRMVFPKLAAT